MAYPYSKSQRPLRKNSSGLADLVIPILDCVVPPILHGFIPHEHLNNDLIVWVPELWPDSAPDPSTFDILTLKFVRDGLPAVPPYRKRLDGPIDLEFPFPIAIPRHYLRDGSVELYYVVEDHVGVESPSDSRYLKIDTTPPNGNVQAPAVGLPTGTVDEDYLQIHPTVDVVVPHYNDRQSFDRVYYYVSNKSPPDDSAADGYEDFPYMDAPVIVPIPGRMFRKFPNGTQYIHIRLADLSGNRGPRSDQSAITVNLATSPIVLKAPVFPSMVDGLINLADARSGVTARVEYDHWAVGDYIHLKFANTWVAPYRVTQSISSVPISWDVLIAAGEGPGSDFASYHITRGLGGDPSPPSPSAPIRWNYTTAGDPNRDAPALVNRDYAKAILYGEGSQTDNYLDLRDQGHRIYARVALYNQPVTGEVLELYFDNFPHAGTAVASYTVNTAAGDVEGKVVEFSTIPWSVFEALGGVSEITMFYSAFNGVNEQLSMATDVVLDIVPPILADRPDFISANLQYWLNCSLLTPMWDHVPIKVPYNPAFKAGDEIIMEWVGYTELGGGGQVISETKDTLTKTLTQADIDAAEADNALGYVLRQDKYEAKIKPIKSPLSDSTGSSAIAVYVVKRGGRVIATSRERPVKIDRKRSGTALWCGPDGDTPEL